MNTESIDCRHVDKPEQPGDFTIQTVTGIGQAGHRLVVWVPGAPHAIAIPLHQGTPEGPAWGWDGSTEKPTCQPSINVQGIWHGYMRAGRLQSV